MYSYMENLLPGGRQKRRGCGCRIKKEKAPGRSRELYGGARGSRCAFAAQMRGSLGIALRIITPEKRPAGTFFFPAFTLPGLTSSGRCSRKTGRKEKRKSSRPKQGALWGAQRESNPRPPEPQSGALTNCAMGTISSAPEGTRTPGPLLRRQLLYPPELRAHKFIQTGHVARDIIPRQGGAVKHFAKKFLHHSRRSAQRRSEAGEKTCPCRGM